MTPMAVTSPRVQNDLQQGSDLEARITASLNSLSRIVHLASEAAVSQLCQYTLAYCVYQRLVLPPLKHSAPRLHRRIENTLPLLELSIPAGASGSLIALRQAYFTLRILEPCNDAFISRYGQPLIDHDPATANIVIQTLLGDDAIRIDEQIEALIHNPDALINHYPSGASATTVTRICQPWPCLSASLGLSSQLL